MYIENVEDGYEVRKHLHFVRGVRNQKLRNLVTVT
jgi:hypothetical protein